MRHARMPLLDPADKARVVHEVQAKLGRVEPKTADIAQRLILLLILTEAAQERGHNPETKMPIPSPDLEREIHAEQTAIHTIVRIREDLYDDALGILENLKA